MDENTRTTSIGTPLDIIGYIPHHLGVRPRDSLVIAATELTPSGRLRIGLMVRVDLGGQRAEAMTGELAAQLAQTVCAGSDDGGFMLFYYDGGFDDFLVSPRGRRDPGILRYQRLTALLDQAFETQGRVVVAAFGIGEERLGSLSGQAFRDGETHRVDEVTASPLATRMVFEGSAPAESLAEACALPDPDPAHRKRFEDARRAWLRTRGEESDRARAQAFLAWAPGIERLHAAGTLESHAGLVAAGALDIEALAAVSVEARRLWVRDALLIGLAGPGGLAMCVQALTAMRPPELGRELGGELSRDAFPGLVGERPEPGETARGTRYLAAWAALEGDRARAMPLAMMGWLHWSAMHMSKAEHYGWRALDADPGTTLAQLLVQAVQNGLPPRWVAERQGVRGPSPI